MVIIYMDLLYLNLCLFMLSRCMALGYMDRFVAMPVLEVSMKDSARQRKTKSLLLTLKRAKSGEVQWGKKQIYVLDIRKLEPMAESRFKSF